MDPFGNHELGIPYQTSADLLATYRARDAAKSAIVDVDQQSTGDVRFCAAVGGQADIKPN